MERASIKVNEHSMVIKHHCVIHIIHFLTSIEPRSKGVIVSRVVNFNKGPINEFNTT
jgi:hypothetical protein